MKVIVIIPFRGSTDLLAWTLQGYSAQIAPDIEIEIKIGLDGPAAPPPLPESTAHIHFHTQSFPRSGAAAIRNRLLQNTSTDIIIFANADARPAPDMIHRHVTRLTQLPPNSLLLGTAPWEPPPNPTVFDALISETPMIFFYHQLTPHQFHDFRHAWTLNLSLRHADFQKSPGFLEPLRPVYYEDLAFAHSLLGTHKGVYFDPDILVTHRHPTTLDQYLNREELLGLMAPVLAQHAPPVFAQLFQNKSVKQLTQDFQHWTALDAPMHRFIHDRLKDWSTQPASSLPTTPADRTRLLTTIYQMHVPLKRLAFRLGFLKGLKLTDDSHWLERQPAALWKTALDDIVAKPT